MKTGQGADTAIGYLIVDEPSNIGYCGGLLVINELGRPLEFHCSSPIRPTRSQQILYGASLRSYLLNEAIGTVIVKTCKQRLDMLLVNDPASWPLSELLGLALVLVDETTATRQSESGGEFDHESIHWTPMEISGQNVRWCSDEIRQPAQLKQVLQPLACRLSLSEPFERIRNALAEAHSMAESQTITHGAA